MWLKANREVRKLSFKYAEKWSRVLSENAHVGDMTCRPEGDSWIGLFNGSRVDMQKQVNTFN